jgi:hypothetical protein
LGLPAARITDLTAHGGVIVAGMPTVVYGGGAPPAPPPPPPPPDDMSPEEIEFMLQGNSADDLRKRREQEREA